MEDEGERVWGAIPGMFDLPLGENFTALRGQKKVENITGAGSGCYFCAVALMEGSEAPNAGNPTHLSRKTRHGA